ncbi:ABC transporter permease subunit [Candidatus Bathyarchaeota archaeon]|nr:ABC transporter permease subunit [Candidatus Bathyarchaeota archaeon]
MRKNEFIASLIWELKSLFRFPFPEVLLAVFTYMIFLPRAGGFTFTIPAESLTWEYIIGNIAFHTTAKTAQSSIFAYLPMAIFASIFATLSFAYEIENGLLKTHLSHPISRRTVFLSKLLSCFILIFVTFSISLLFQTFLRITEIAIYLILSPDMILKLLLMATLQSLFMVSITISFSLYSGKTSVSLIGSFATLYLIQLLSESANLEFLPPISFRQQISFLFSKTAANLSQLPNFLTIPIVSLFLIVLSYLFFTRRLEVG